MRNGEERVRSLREKRGKRKKRREESREQREEVPRGRMQWFGPRGAGWCRKGSVPKREEGREQREERREKRDRQAPP